MHEIWIDGEMRRDSSRNSITPLHPLSLSFEVSMALGWVGRSVMTAEGRWGRLDLEEREGRPTDRLRQGPWGL